MEKLHDSCITPHVLPLSVGLVFLIALSGCQPSGRAPADKSGGAGSTEAGPGPHQSSGESTNAETEAEVGADSNVENVTLEAAGAERLQDLLERYRGNVVLVDFWATWCVPCKKNFPKVVDYSRKYAQQGLRVVSVSMDDESAHEQAIDFLKTVGASFPNLRSKWGAGSKSAEQFEFSGEVPYYKLYDRSGELRYDFSANADTREGVEPIEQMQARVEELLASDPE